MLDRIFRWCFRQLLSKCGDRPGAGGLTDETYALMTESELRIVSVLETHGLDPCPAISQAQEIMEPAFKAWEKLLAARSEGR